MINGAAAPCAFTNCVFAGNQNTYSCIYQSGCTGTAGGAVVLYLANSDVAAVFENCTIAYNLSDGYNLPAGIDVVRGRARVHNSIVAENVKSSICTVGVDIAVWPAGSLDISYTRLSSAGEGSLWCAAAENVVASNLTYGDPMFVTPVADFLSHAHTNGTSYIDYNNAGLLFTSTIDVHLKSKRGYYDNAGALHTAAGVFSDCIDAGDPTSGYGREPTLPFSAGNGKRVNLGAYGNTPEASMSPLSGCMILLM